MSYILILSILFLLVIAFWYFGRKPVIHKNISQDDLNIFLKELLFRGYDGGFIIIQVPKDKKTKRFIQFKKHINSSKSVKLQFDFPLAEWSKPYYEGLKILLQKNEINFEIEKTDCESVPEFIVVNIKQDLEKGVKISKLILQNLFGLNDHDSVEVYIENISPNEEKIGF